MIRAPRFIETALGTECRCARCGEYWPADREFFSMLRGKPHSWCKACHIEWRLERGLLPGYGKRGAYSDRVTTQ